MEYTGEITRADGEEEPLYVEHELHVMVAAYFAPHIRNLQDGDSICISRTK